MADEWQSTACILCECNCGIVVQIRRPQAGQDPRRQGTSGVAGLHLQQGAAPGPLPEQPQPADLADAPTARRQLRGDRLGHRHCPRSRRASDASRDTYGGDKIFYYGGGGQGNHLGGAYSGAFLKALGSHYRSNALAQEKTGEAWVDAHLYGGHTRGEFEHAEVSVFIGKNPWMSQSFPRARTVLNEIAKDPERAMIVIDPVITDTAKLADFHLRVRPGTDAWALAALAAVLVQEELCDDAFLAEHVTGVEPVLDVLRTVDVGDYALRCGARRGADSDSGAPHRHRSKRVRVRGSGHPAGSQQHAVLVPEQVALDPHRKLRETRWPASAFVVRAAVPPPRDVGRTPVTGAPIVGGLIPSNAVPQEILGDHPDRFRAMIVESSNPAHSTRRFQCVSRGVRLAGAAGGDRRRDDRDRAAGPLRAARRIAVREDRGDVLQPRVPAQHFPSAAPADGAARRAPCPSPRSGRDWSGHWAWSTTPTWTRCAAPPREGLEAFTRGLSAGRRRESRLGKVLPYVLYETLGPTLPDGLSGAAALWGLAQKVAMSYPEAVRRAGYADGNALFDAILSSRSGVTFTDHEYEDDFALISHADHKIALEMPEMLDEIRALADATPQFTTPDFPIVLSAGERRAYTANDIFRDPAWRKRDADGALRVSLEDAEALGLVHGARARITTAAGSAEASVEISEAMLPGHASLPNGFGLDFADGEGQAHVPGVAPNALTPATGATRMPARHGTSMCRPVSKRCPQSAVSTA